MNERQARSSMERLREAGLWGAAIVVLGGILYATPISGALLTWMHQAPARWLVALLAALALVGSTALIARLWRPGYHSSLSRDNREASFSAPLNPNPVLEFDAKGTLQYANPAALQCFPDLLHHPDTHPFLTGLHSVAATLPRGTPARMMREVTVADVVYEQHFVRVPHTNALRLFATDITQRKHAAEARQLSEEKFARVFRSAPMAISISRLSDGRFIDVNDSFVRLLGHNNRRAIVGRTAGELGLWVNGNDRARVLALLSKDDAAVHSLETQIRPRDGSVRDVIMSVEVMDFGGTACVLSTLLDVTERNEAETGIAVLKAFYENTLKELPIEVAVYDAEGRFFYQNPEALRDEELRFFLVGKTSVDFAQAQGFDPAPYERRHQWVLDVVRHKEIRQFEEVLTGHDGHVRHLVRVATPVLDEEDEVIYVVSYGIDITERKQFEQKLLEAKNAAEEMARLKSAFVANMSHEVRTPLTAILGFATVLGEEVNDPQRELAQIIKQSGERLLETLNSVLDLARVEANAIELDPQPLNLNEELLAATRLYKPMALKKGLTFTVETPGTDLYAQLDRACLHRVLSNLLSNAIKFTDEGAVYISLRMFEDEVQVQVQDTGVGIGADFLPHVFEEFKQESTGLSRTHTGSGLGLAITRHLVERMNGVIDVTSTKGEGSTFTVTFPVMAPHSDLEPALDASIAR